jgi:hypothetical protein
MEVLSAKPQLRLLLDHFATIKDTRQSWKVAYPLRELLLLVVSGTITSGDYDDIVDWGEAHLSFLRRFAEFHYGIPCSDWLRTVMNRVCGLLFVLGRRLLAGPTRPHRHRRQGRPTWKERSP